MIPTVEGIFAGVRSALGDDQEPGGQIFTDGMQREHLARAYERLMGEMLSLGVPYVEKKVYYNLPAYTAVLTPAQLGIADFGEPISVWERGNLTKATVTGASADSPIVITAAGHPFSTNDEVIISGVGAGADGRWFVTRLNANSFSLNGSTGIIAYSGVTGSAATSSEKFIEMAGVARLAERDAMERLLEYAWEEDVFQFKGATAERQLKIEYTASGDLPQTGSLGIDACGSFLIADTAWRAATSRDMLKSAQVQKATADEALLKFLNIQVKSMQRVVWRPLPFRCRRNWLF